MPIRIANNLPAREILEKERIFVMEETRALNQDIRPIRIIILNLMPNKAATETQLMRAFSNTPIQVDVDLMRVASHVSTHTSEDHLFKFYETFDDVKERYYDGMIITGAPVELMEYEDVDYWPELCEIMEWSKTHVYSTMYICWGAMAGLYYHYGVPKYELKEKAFGVFEHSMTFSKPVKLFRGFDDVFYVPHSRHTEVRREDIAKCDDLRILSESEECGVYAVSDKRGRQFFIMGHSEYDRTTLDDEYRRDLSKGLPIKMPINYYKNDDPDQGPVLRWRSSASLLFSNWLNFYVYQETPFDLSLLEEINHSDSNIDTEINKGSNN